MLGVQKRKGAPALKNHSLLWKGSDEAFINADDKVEWDISITLWWPLFSVLLEHLAKAGSPI